MALLNAIVVNVTPSDCERLGSFHVPVMMTTIAVIKHTMMVSMKGPIIATRPSRTGSSVFAAAWAMAALPRPASLEKEERLIPHTSTPTNPP